MGIDVYMSWKGMTKEEREAQYTGWDIHSGDVGYLREAYHGEPYATRAFLPEAFDKADEPCPGQQNGKCPEECEDCHEVMGYSYASKVLEDRLPKVMRVAAQRERKLYKGNPLEVFKTQKSYVDFVELAKKKEELTGTPVTVYVSG